MTMLKTLVPGFSTWLLASGLTTLLVLSTLIALFSEARLRERVPWTTPGAASFSLTL